MTKTFKPHGPYKCRCLRCGKVMSTLARRNHRCETEKEKPRCQ
jgi:hypothetical protein